MEHITSSLVLWLYIYYYLSWITSRKYVLLFICLFKFFISNGWNYSTNSYRLFYSFCGNHLILFYEIDVESVYNYSRFDFSLQGLIVLLENSVHGNRNYRKHGSDMEHGLRCFFFHLLYILLYSRRLSFSLKTYGKKPDLIRVRLLFWNQQ